MKHVAKLFCSLFVFFLSIPQIQTQQMPFFLTNPGPQSSPEKWNDLGLKVQHFLNKSANPCDNFYGFACGNWIANTPKPKSELSWNQFLIVTHLVNNRLQMLLEDETDSSESLIKAKTFYNACMNVGQDADEHLYYLKILVRFCDGWPIIHEHWAGEKQYNWLVALIKIYKMVRVQPLLKINIDIDYKNTSKYALYIAPGNLIFPQHILLNPEQYLNELSSYKLWIFKTIQHLYNTTENRHLRLEVLKIIEFEIKLASLMDQSVGKRTTVSHLSHRFPVDWLKILSYLFNNNTKLVGDDTVVIVNYAYFKKLFILLKLTDKRTIANYLAWCAVKEMSREMTDYMRNLSHLVDKDVLGVEADLSRSIECVQDVTKYFSLALVPKYVEKFVKPNALDVVQEMTDNIKEQFVRLLENSDWLSKETKVLAVEKVRNLKRFIGFPEWLRNQTKIDDYYHLLNVTRENHFVNVLVAKNFLVEQQLSLIDQRVTNIMWPENLFEPNAYYSVLQNAIFLPFSILEPPFFDVDQPSVFNYGALGTLIGHEISHSLDTTGRKANKHGIVTDWWPQFDIFSYEKRTLCFVQQYDSYSSNGATSIGENIADSTGMEISFLAFRNSTTHNKLAQAKVPHLQEFSKEQIFFLTFAQVWCEKSDTKQFSDKTYATFGVRVKGTLSNSEFFQSSFHCDTANVVKKCTLW